jgi:hypothetical protein
MDEKLKQIARRFGVVENIDCFRALANRNFESVDNWCRCMDDVAQPRPDYLCMLEVIARACASRESLDSRERVQAIKLFAISRACLCEFYDLTIDELDSLFQLDRSMLFERYGAIFE